MTKSDKLIESGVSRAAFQEIRRTVECMLEVILQPNANTHDRERACSTIRDAFASRALSSEFAVNLAAYELSEAASDVSLDRRAAELDTQEGEFAEKLRDLMKARAITQAELASRIGCSQPAISLMLKRQCRPQKNTILKLASALNVAPQELWPDLEITEMLDTVAAAQEEQIMSDAEADALRRALERPATNAPTAPLPKRKR